MNDAYAKQIVHHLVEQGVRRVCISPGSRSTPLAYAFSQEDFVYIDWRVLCQLP